MGLKLHEFGNQQYGKGEIFYNMCMSVCGWYLKTQEAPLKKDLHIECVNKYYIKTIVIISLPVLQSHS